MAEDTKLPSTVPSQALILAVEICSFVTITEANVQSVQREGTFYA